MKRPLIITIVGLVILLVVLIKLDPFSILSPKSPYLCKDCNLIVITLTNLRYDHLSTDGYSRQTSPNLDALAKESLVFDNAFSHSSWTLPEGISIFTSLYPYQHGVMDRYDGSVLSKNTPTLIDILNDKGYKTAAFTGGFDYDPRYGLTSRYQDHEECQDTGTTSISQYGKLKCTIPKALDWIKNNKGSKFFVHLQGFDTHCPFSKKGGGTFDPGYNGNIDFSSCLWTFDKTDPIYKDGVKYFPVYSSASTTATQILLTQKDVDHLVALYDESIKDSDTQIGDFLDQINSMGLDNNTIIVFTSEHGDMFGKYGRFMRGGPLRGTFYDDVLHIPLMMKIPNVNPARLNELVQQVDIMPTILDILGLKKPTSLSGKSMIPVIFYGKEINDYVFAGSEFHAAQDEMYVNKNTRIEMVRSKSWKLIKEMVLEDNPPAPSYELFDLGNDKEELHNLAGTNTDMLKSLEKILDNWSKAERKK